MKLLFVFAFITSLSLASASRFFNRFRHHKNIICPPGESFQNNECTPVSCESEKACNEGEVCVPHKCGLLRGRFSSSCKKFDCNANSVEVSTPEDVDGIATDEDCSEYHELDGIGRCVPVTCDAPDACSGDSICERKEDIECFAAPCIKFVCVAIDCMPGSEWDRDSLTCVPITCDFKGACKEGYTCIPERKMCITQPCPQFDCIPDDQTEPGVPDPDEPIPMPPVQECRENYEWDPDAWTCTPVSCEAPDACLGGTCTSDEARQCVTTPCQKFDCECPERTHQYDAVTGHCVPLTCEADDACTGEGEVCQDVAQLCIGTRPCKQYFCAREGGDPEPEPEPLPCKPGYVFDDFKQDCVPDSCKPCLADGLACILPDADCFGSCAVRCVENPCIFSLCPTGSQCQVSTECEGENLDGMTSEVCAKCVSTDIEPILPTDPCAATLCPKGTTCQVSRDCGSNLSSEEICSECVPQDDIVSPLCAATLCPEGTICQVTQDCEGSLSGEELCTECVPHGEPEPLSCSDPFACKPGYVCIEDASDALDIWCYPDPCATIRCMSGHVCRATKNVDCGSDTPLDGDCPPVQGECVPVVEEPPVPDDTGDNNNEETGDVDGGVSILCAQGFELDTVTNVCEPVSCEANPCGKDEECVPADIRCVRAPCKQYECQPV